MTNRPFPIDRTSAFAGCGHADVAGVDFVAVAVAHLRALYQSDLDLLGRILGARSLTPVTYKSDAHPEPTPRMIFHCVVPKRALLSLIVNPAIGALAHLTTRMLIPA